MCVLTVTPHEGTYVAHARLWRRNARVKQTHHFCRTIRHTPKKPEPRSQADDLTGEREPLISKVTFQQDSNHTSGEVGVWVWGDWAVPRSFVWSELCCLSR